ncbi:MAG TPA: tRNA (adenosine(37)-N6)-threonylcarbamoyltransferase complex transferase subunit TsaD [Bacteroidales bacterium]|nr:tRNA (adenosine(37)-N6)-threonylcarbamoyltransferase complex transferase subunit TsaD [Bacteroidales bacterium]
MSICILGIESSCDDTSASILCDGIVLSNVINTQIIHSKYGGVVPELASRAHQQNIIPVVAEALSKANKKLSDISAISFTKGPGLLGSLLVGSSFAKALSVAISKPLIGVNHLHGHIFTHFLRNQNELEFEAKFPFLCLLVSGGHTQIIRVNNYTDFEVIGTTIDDAAGEAFDKCAKVLGLGYPGGVDIDNLSKDGNSDRFKFGKPKIAGLDYSFSGIKTSFLYFLRDHIRQNKDFVQDNLSDLCASLQSEIIEILIDKLIKAVKMTGITEISVSGGVSANSCLRSKLSEIGEANDWNIYLPEKRFTTDNAAMVALIGYYYYLDGKTDSLDISPQARIVL